MVIKGNRPRKSEVPVIQPVAKPAKSAEKQRGKKGPGKGQDIFEVSTETVDPKDGN